MDRGEGNLLIPTARQGETAGLELSESGSYAHGSREYSP